VFLDIKGTSLEKIGRSIGLSQLNELRGFGDKVNKFGFNFAVCGADNELILMCDGGKFTSDCDRLKECSRLSCHKNTEAETVGTGGSVLRFNQDSVVLAVALKSSATGSETEESFGTALVDLGDVAVDGDIHGEYCVDMLELLAEKFQIAACSERQIEIVSSELSQTYEELVLLHKLSTNMKVTKSDTNYLQMACDNLTNIVSVEGIAILLERAVEDEKKFVLAAGSGLIDIDDQMAGVLHLHLSEEISSGKEALLDSEVDSPFKYDWPGVVKNIIAVPLFGKGKPGGGSSGSWAEADNITGMMVAINRGGKPDFDSIDVKLFNSVANGCAVFVENSKLFKELKELFIGSLKALTSSIDAKDKYTRGHSDRVAFICRWIAEKLAEKRQLPQEQIHRIYLAGLLHDIGKMGISEAVLRKKGKLTKQEIEHIRTHPSIGAGILGEIKQMDDVVRGILSHHERVDGKGYPNGIGGEQIPLIGKIICLADSFDAMTVEQALAEIESQLGKQFDEEIGRVFLNSDVYRLWDIMQDGLNTVYDKSSFSEYGAIAVESLIR